MPDTPLTPEGWWPPYRSVYWIFFASGRMKVGSLHHWKVSEASHVTRWNPYFTWMLNMFCVVFDKCWTSVMLIMLSYILGKASQNGRGTLCQLNRSDRLRLPQFDPSPCLRLSLPRLEADRFLVGLSHRSSVRRKFRKTSAWRRRKRTRRLWSRC